MINDVESNNCSAFKDKEIKMSDDITRKIVLAVVLIVLGFIVLGSLLS